MGNAYSIISSGRADTSSEIAADTGTMEGETSGSASHEETGRSTPHLTDDEETDKRKQLREEDLSEFRKQLDIKRELRMEILSRHRTEKEKLKQSLAAETKSKLKLIEKNKVLLELLRSNNIEVPDDLHSTSEDAEVVNTVTEMREELNNIKSSNIKLRRDLADTNGALQGAYSEIADLSAQNTESIKQIHALKEVITVSKTLIGMREQQLNELKNKLSEIEKSLADREASMLSTDLRQEYERQLQNIRTLRGLYEERARLAEVTRQGLLRELEEQKALSQTEANKSKELSEKVQTLETEINELKATVENKSDQIRSSRTETQGLKAEMSAVNKLFSQVLLGYKTEHDLDKLVQRLEENHGLLTQMAEKEDGSEGSSALPKLLLELVSQVEEEVEKLENEAENADKENNENEPDGSQTKQALSTTAEEIVQNLPKVWRVLMELLSHQNLSDNSTDEKVTTCYKSVETSSGPVLVPSVSQTYIRLKDLIVEKLALIKEVNKMKQLNVHLESRLEEQERRLCLVTTELSKTWHVVGRLRRHHHQLHTHEKILKYELQQKRKLLNELKEELEYCREKWDQAREKNTQSEKDWRKLRAEFSSRKTKSVSSSLNNSAESGYSDERPSDESSESNDESEYINEPPRCKQKAKNSFETILDSSTELNVAEREDPVSDMIDVAELPLDSQDGEEHHEISNCLSYDNPQANDRNIVETEDEAGDISLDTLPQADETYKNNLPEEATNSANVVSDTRGAAPIECKSAAVIVDAKAILESIKKQNERLAKRDKKFEDLEKKSLALLNQTKNTAKLSEQINDTLDVLINRPSSSRDTNAETVSETTSMVTGNTENQITDQVKNSDADDIKEQSPIELCELQVINTDEPGNINNTDTLETHKNYSDAVDDTNLEKTEAILTDETSKTDTTVFQTVQNSLPDRSESRSSSEETSKRQAELSQDDSEPSTSEVDHEARFAARDLRLKSLEEQAKSLVNIVNKTTSKRVKLHYKLEELHNIYGSDSRSGTPFDENDDCSDSNEDE